MLKSKVWLILCLYFWGPAEMTGNNFKEKKVVPLIFTQFWSRSHLSKLDPTRRLLKLGMQVIMRGATVAFYSDKTWVGDCPPWSIISFAPVKFLTKEEVYQIHSFFWLLCVRNYWSSTCTPPRPSEISRKYWRAKVKSVLTTHFWKKAMLKVWTKLWEPLKHPA